METEHPAAVPVVDFRGVAKRFGETMAVAGMTFAVAPGETISLLGPSGCGKTTTLRLISGFEEPDEGRIEIAGEPMRGKRPYERNVGLLFQHYALFPHMTVAENVAYGLKYRGWPKRAMAERVGEMLRLVQLEGLENRLPAKMSGGQQQRVALARTLATRPKLVLLDEPLSALDAKLRQELRIELKRILAAVGSTTIVVTHDQDEAMSLADRIIVMNGGRIEQEGTPGEIYARPRTGFVASFIGRANWFHGRLSPAPDAPFASLVTPSGVVLSIAKPSPEMSGEASICVRPERIALMGPDATTDQAGETLLPGRVDGVINLGAEIHYIVEGADGRVTVVEPNRDVARAREGDAVKLLIRAKDCAAFPAKGGRAFP